MLKIDTGELSYFLHKRGFTKSSLSRELGINRNTLALYLDEPERMTLRTVNLIAQILELKDEEFRRIFFYP